MWPLAPSSATAGAMENALQPIEEGTVQDDNKDPSSNSIMIAIKEIL